MLPFDLAASYQIVLTVLVCAVSLSFGQESVKRAALAAAVWLILYLIAQDVTKNITPAFIGILIGSVTCWIVRFAHRASKTNWVMKLHHIVVSSMILDLSFIILSPTVYIESFTEFYKHAGALLFVVFLFWILANTKGIKNHVSRFRKSYQSRRMVRY